MIATPNLDEILGAEVVDPNDETVGKVGRIYLDSERDIPTWVSVRTGLFGLAESLVPVDDATWEGQVLRVTVDKARIKDAPRVDVEQEIAPEDQERLYTYYDRASGADAAAGVGDAGSTVSGPAGGGRHVDRSGEFGSDSTAAPSGAAAGGGMGPRSDEPLGGGNQSPADFDVDREQRIRDGGRSVGDGRLGGGNQNPDLLEGPEQFGTDIGELGGGNQNPALYEGREDRRVAAGELGGGNQNPGGGAGLTDAGAGGSTQGGPGEFTGPGAGLAEAARRNAAEDDPGRMHLAGEEQGGAMRMSEGGGPAAAPGAAGERGAGTTGAGGGMRLRRYVVTEQQTVTMPVTREEYRLEPDGGEEEGGRPR